MSKPFQIVLGFNRPIDMTPGSIMMVDVEIKGLDPELDREEMLVHGLAYVLAMQMKNMTEGPPDQVGRAFLNFMAAVWNNTPEPMPIDLTGAGVADA